MRAFRTGPTMGNPPTHPVLDGHDVLGFNDGLQFAQVVEDQLVHGRAMVRSATKRVLNDRLLVHVHAPGTGQRLDLDARVVFARDELLGLEFTDLDAPRKDLLRSMVATACPSRPAPPADAEPPPPPPPAQDQPPVDQTSDRDPTDAKASGASSTEPKEATPSSPPSHVWQNDQLHIADPGFLLALYLQSLKGPPLDLAAPYELGPRSIELHLADQSALVSVVILEGGRVDIPDPSPFVPLLERHTASLARLLAPVGLVDGTTDIEATPDASELLPAPQSPATTDDGPPRMPTLDERTVVFRSMRDLEHERDVNVRNGGLFVESGPLPLRQRVQLHFRVGERDAGFSLEADVVFADAGRVGFSFTNPSEAQRHFQNPPLAPAPPPRSPSQVATTDISRVSGSRDLPAFTGEIAPPLALTKLLDLTAHALDDPGSLGRAPTLLLFEYLAREKQTGVLELRKEGGSVSTLYLYQGDVAFVEAKPFDESVSLGRILVTQKKVSEGGLREALERARGSHRLLGRMLILLGIIKRGELVAALREQSRAKIDATFAWSTGHYAWGPWRDPPGEADLVVTRSLGVLARHIRLQLERTSARDLELMFGRGMAGVMQVQDLDHLSTTLQLQPKEMRFLELQLDGRRTVHDAVTGSPIGRLGALRLLATCLALGLARFTDGSQSMDLEDGSAASQSSKDAGALSQLEEELQRIKSSNHFDVLGVHWSSHQRNYREAWEQKRKTYDPAQFENAGPEAKKLAQDIQRHMDNAYDAIKDAALRSTYRRKLFDSTERQYAADMLVKQGELALMRGDRVKAIEALETALELHPSQKVQALLANARETR